MVSTKLAIVTPLADMNMVSTITDDILAVDAGVLQVLNHPRLIGAIVILIVWINTIIPWFDPFLFHWSN